MFNSKINLFNQLDLFVSLFKLATLMSCMMGLGAFADGMNPEMFTDEEKSLHLEQIDTITAAATQCLISTSEKQKEFFKKYGVTKYFGDRNPKYSSLEKRKSALVSLGKDPRLALEQEPISCIGLTRKCLREGFKAADMDSTWLKIDRELAKDSKFDGTDLQKMLRYLGWKVLYWNPNPDQNALWDAEDRAINPLPPNKKWNGVWGGHAYNYSMVKKRGTYYGVPVDDDKLLVGFDQDPPDEFKEIPFFVGTAHSGYHVFPGYMGNVIEGHSMRALDSIDNIEVSVFNPLGTGGGPRWTRSERYRSGIIAVPPQK